MRTKDIKLFTKGIGLFSTALMAEGNISKHYDVKKNNVFYMTSPIAGYSVALFLFSSKVACTLRRLYDNGSRV